MIIGENHSFDNVFATYRPPGHQYILNLMSEGIINPDGSPGPNFGKAAQLKASDKGAFSLTPTITGKYATLPAPNTTYMSKACDGLAGNSADTRFPASLPNGPFQITKYVPYFDSHIQYSSSGQCELFGAYVGDPLHRFYQMWQQTATPGNGLNTPGSRIRQGTTTAPHPPAPIFQGGVSMGFYNMAQGDAPIMRDLAQDYAISDNYHQAVQGGTGEPDQEPEPEAGHQQQLQPGRVLGRVIFGVRQREPAGRRSGRRIPREAALQGVQQLPAGTLLHPEQLQPRLQP